MNVAGSVDEILDLNACPFDDDDDDDGGGRGGGGARHFDVCGRSTGCWPLMFSRYIGETYLDQQRKSLSRKTSNGNEKSISRSLRNEFDRLLHVSHGDSFE